MRIKELVSNLKENWSTPAHAEHRGEKTVFLLSCSFEEAVPVAEDKFPFPIPPDMNEFWQIASGAQLFKDQEYGQWGLEILSPGEAYSVTQKTLEERKGELNHTDLIIGRFWGDSDLLGLICDKASDYYGSVFVIMPIDKRPDWPVVAPSFTDFLEKYSKLQGDKYWE
jgi:hypothetical protein